MRIAIALWRFARLRTILWFTACTVLGFSSVLFATAPPISFFWVIVPIAMLNIGAIITNDVADHVVDGHSVDLAKIRRPLITGLVTLSEAKLLAGVFLIGAVLLSSFLGVWMLMFSIAVVLLTMVYSLPPFMFSSRRWGSLLFWPLLCAVCYFFWLQIIGNASNSMAASTVWQKVEGWIFIAGVITFMGVGEIVSKDLRDLDCDRLGGRRTFVHSVSIHYSTRLMSMTCWIGSGLWLIAVSLSHGAALKPIIVLLAVVSVDWCIKVAKAAKVLRQSYDHALAAAVHEQWTRVYAVMQLFTAATFIE